MGEIRSRSYRMKTDSGHAPCPFDRLDDIIKITDENYQQFHSNILTLSNCGSKFRHLLKKDKWVFGIAGSKFGKLKEKLIWIGKVYNVIGKGEYYRNFNPNLKKSYKNRFGYDGSSRPDNYYGEDIDTNYLKNAMVNNEGKDLEGIKLFRMFNNPFHSVENIKTDLYDSKRSNIPLAITILFKEWWYFGKNAIEIDEEFIPISQEAKILEEKAIIEFIKNLRKDYGKPGIYGPPASLDIKIKFELDTTNKDSACTCKPPIEKKEIVKLSWRNYISWWIKTQL
ncbi:MAG: hypothetical protein ACFFCM_19980 [Promethearchaeota archaeon]